MKYQLIGLFFRSIAIGYFLAYLIYIPPLMKQRKVLRKDPDAAPELRLQPLLYRKFFNLRPLFSLFAIWCPSADVKFLVAPLETIGLFGFAWTSLGPPHVHWIAPMIFSCLVGIANYAIYMSTID